MSADDYRHPDAPPCVPSTHTCNDRIGMHPGWGRAGSLQAHSVRRCRQAVGERFRCVLPVSTLYDHTHDIRHLRTEERVDVCQCRFVTDHCSVLFLDVLDCVLGISYGNSCNRRYPFPLPHGLIERPSVRSVSSWAATIVRLPCLCAAVSTAWADSTNGCSHHFRSCTCIDLTARPPASTLKDDAGQGVRKSYLNTYLP